jgi:LacI family transcriptional regulator
MEQWLAAHRGQPLPDAIFGGNDGIAIGCMEALAAVGVRVPDDLSICGFDDTLAARTTVPQLATIRQPLRRMGSSAVEVLLKRIDTFLGKAPESAQPSVVFDTEVILRDSVARVPAGERLVPARA